MLLQRIINIGLSCLLVAFTAQLNAADQPSIIDGKVDEKIFQGWQTFHAVCGLCHGDSGQGNPAPDLTERLKTISREQFVYVVTNGKGLMPPWKDNLDVMGNVDNIYAYLKARSDGELKSGKPTKQ